MKKLLNRRRLKPTKTDSGTRFTEPTPASSHSSEPTSPQAIPSLGTYHQSCETLPYARYVDIMCGKGVKCLVIAGEVEESVLQGAWENILSEYSSLIKTPKADAAFNAYQRLVSSKWKMAFMELAVRALRSAGEVPIYLAHICEQVTLLGFNYIADPEGDWDSYNRQVDGIETEAKSLVVFFNQAKAEYELLAPKGGEVVVERDRMSYEIELQVLTKFRGSPIDDEAITVLRYAAIVNLYLESLKKTETN